MAHLISTRYGRCDKQHLIAFTLSELRDALDNEASFLCVAIQCIARNLLNVRPGQRCIIGSEVVQRALSDVNPFMFKSPEETGRYTTLLDHWLKWETIHSNPAFDMLYVDNNIHDNLAFRVMLLNEMIKVYGPDLEFQIDVTVMTY
jgi:hypothetical protein